MESGTELFLVSACCLAPLFEFNIIIMCNNLSSFGFHSRAAQMTYPFLIFGMLLVHRYVYPDNPELKNAEITASIAALIVYLVSRKFVRGPRVAPYRAQIRLIEKFLEVFIGVTVISSIAYSLIFGYV